MELKRFAKRGFWAVVILFPVFWLVFTAEGQRFADTTLLKLTGREAMRINFDELYPDIAEAQLQQAWPDLTFQCKEATSDFGSRLCATPIAAFNNIPARYVTFFFDGEQLRAVKIGYQRPYHETVIAQFKSLLGQPMVSTQQESVGVYQWRAGGGLVVTPHARLSIQDEPALFWLARRP